MRRSRPGCECPENTVRTHTQNFIGKLGVHSSLEAVTLALRYRYYVPPLSPEPDGSGPKQAGNQPAAGDR